MARLRRFWQRCMGGCGAMTCGRRPIQEVRTEKARGRFPGAGFLNSCDDANMPVICPTCQIFEGDYRRFYSNP